MELGYFQREQVIYDLAIRFMKVHGYELNPAIDIDNFREMSNPKAWSYFRMAEKAVYYFEYELCQTELL